jgi:preprotein translocase subunit YajC
LVDPDLERRMKAEVRREMEVAEAESRLMAARQSSLRDALAVSVQSGDEITVASGTVSFRGVPRYVRGDLLSMEGTAAMIECRLVSLDEVMIGRRGAGGGSSMVHEAESFAARLGLIELSGESVEVVTVGGRHIRGRLSAVGRDHIVVAAAEDHRSMIPMERIAFVIRPHQGHPA